MTDKEIMQMLEKASIDDMCRECSSCDFYKSTWCDGDDGVCKERLAINALELIKRQATEIERLEEKLSVEIADGGASCHMCIEKHKTEAIKEFVRKLKAEHSEPDIFMPFNWISCEEMVLDEIAKEMVGDSDARDII